MSRKQNLLPKTCVGHARLLKTTATTTTTHAHAVTTHNHSVHLGDGQNSLLPGLKTPALVENFCSKLNRPATNQILLRTAKTSRDCRKLRKTAWYQRIFVSHQLSSSDAHIFTGSMAKTSKWLDYVEADEFPSALLNFVVSKDFHGSGAAGDPLLCVW